MRSLRSDELGSSVSANLGSDELESSVSTGLRFGFFQTVKLRLGRWCQRDIIITVLMLGRVPHMLPVRVP